MSAAREVARALVVSTAHVTPEERDAFDAGEHSPDGIAPFMRGAYGWMFYIGQPGDVDLTGQSPGFQAAAVAAFAEGCDWLRFDSDASELEGAPTYEY